jgi:hypothetical protein
MPDKPALKLARIIASFSPQRKFLWFFVVIGIITLKISSDTITIMDEFPDQRYDCAPFRP